MVAAVGEAGVGKSRLMYEFVHSHRTQGWLVLESASVSCGKATPYFPVIDLLKLLGDARRTGHRDRDVSRHVVSGKVVASSPNKEEIYQQLLKTKGMDIAIEYAGDTVQDLSVMFALWPPIR